MNQEKVTRMKKLIQGFSDYVGTKKSYCESHQVKPHVFDYWRKKLQRPIKSSSSFIPISLQESKAPLLVPVQLEVCYNNGRSIRLPSNTPISLLEQLLKLQVDV